MQQFECTFCGLREQSEFTYLRETAPLPALDADAAEWQRYVYPRDTPAGPPSEWWHHHHGCRQMLVIVRDTLTHAVLRVTPARTVFAASPEPAATRPVAATEPEPLRLPA